MNKITKLFVSVLVVVLSVVAVSSIFEKPAYALVSQEVEIHRLVNKKTGYHHYTTDASEVEFLKTSEYGLANWTYEGIKMVGFDMANGGSQSVHRFANKFNGQHFFTNVTEESDFLKNSVYGQANWTYENLPFASLNDTNLPLAHRFANKVNGEHFYTIDTGEVTFLQTSEYGQANWVEETSTMHFYEYPRPI